MKFNKNVLFVIFISTTIGTLSYGMDRDDFTPALSRKAKRRAKRAAAVADAIKGAEQLNEAIAEKGGTVSPQRDGLAKKIEDSKDVAPKSSWIAKIVRNKFKVIAGLIVLAEAADIAQAWLKTTKEELKDKSLAQQADVIKEKTYMLAIVREGSRIAKDKWNAGTQIALNLKLRAQDYLNKKKQTA